MSDYIAKALQAGNENAARGMHTAFPALVISYNSSKHTATIQPLYKFSDGNNYPQIQNVPVAKQRYSVKHYHVDDLTGSAGGITHTHTMSEHTETEVEERLLLVQAGDVVFCICSEKSIDTMMSKQIHLPQSKRAFDISDAIIVCIL